MSFAFQSAAVPGDRLSCFHTFAALCHVSSPPQQGSTSISGWVSGPAGCTGVFLRFLSLIITRPHQLSCKLPLHADNPVLQVIYTAVELTQAFPGGAGSVIDSEVSKFALRRCVVGEYAQDDPAICYGCPPGSFTLQVVVATAAAFQIVMRFL
jgi:hypothetical protein